MKQTQAGFSLFEVILYLGLFSVMAVAIFEFSFTILDLGIKERATRYVVSDGQIISERLNGLIRNADSIDTEASLFGTDGGRIVLRTSGSSDGITVQVDGGHLIMIDGESPPVILSSTETRVESFILSLEGNQDDGSEYVGYAVRLASKNDATAPARYQAGTTIRSGASLRQ